ncbi:MAG TPA: HlyD family efflux transporter periplasmic adaptor subunit [Thermoanaerobaculia bacterium]|jgi:HlyD family secretion protein|nr:HlyD family efflux transporter periplasmic adaptor subunit [Thermoanaerobaculia bacterium]
MMDRELSPEEIRKSRLRRAAQVGVPLLLVAVVLTFLPGWLRPSISRARIRTARVERGTVEGSFTAAGLVVPAFEKVLSSPVEARVLRLLKRPGDRVRAGEPLVELDLGALHLDAERQDEQLAQKRNAAERERLRLAGELGGLADQREGARLDHELASFHLEQTKRLRKEGLAAEDALRQAEVAETKARLEEARLGREIDTARRQGAAQLRALELEAQVLAQERAATGHQLELGTTRADRDGVVTWVVPQEGATIPRGAPVARVADLSAFGVEGTVSDVHAAALRPGLPVRITAGDASLDGAVETVFPTIEEGTVRFRVALAEPSHRALRNNLRVDVEVVTERLPAVLRLPRGAALQGGRQQVFVVDTDRARRRAIELGASGPQGWEVRSGLAEGDEVILSDMTDFLHAEEIRIR